MTSLRTVGGEPKKGCFYTKKMMDNYWTSDIYKVNVICFGVKHKFSKKETDKQVHDTPRISH